uniref:Uncharacterized protein n=1 Tax=Arundo donax TaxID=35708 RepID=A0A0A9BP65_ARUDO
MSLLLLPVLAHSLAVAQLLARLLWLGFVTSTAIIIFAEDMGVSVVACMSVRCR